MTLLAVLLLHANRAVARDTLVESLWGPAADSNSFKRLQVAVARLRKTLEPLEAAGGDPRLRTVGGGYTLTVAPSELDAELFALQVREGHELIAAGAPERAVETLRAAEALWRGPVFADVAYEAFAQAEVRRPDELRLTAIEARLDAELGLGRHAMLIGELEALVAGEPTRELLAGQLVLALYRSGRQAEALEALQRTRTHMREELGLDAGRGSAAPPGANPAPGPRARAARAHAAAGRARGRTGDVAARARPRAGASCARRGHGRAPVPGWSSR